MQILKFLVNFVLVFTGVFSIMQLGHIGPESNPLLWLWIIPSQLVIAPAFVHYKGII